MNIFATSATLQPSGAPRFLPALLRAFIISLLALFLGLKCVFPGYFHPFAALHSDMYMMVAGTVGKWDLAACWTAPRPVLSMAASLAGDFGFEGSLIIFSVVALLDFALMIALLEVYYIRGRFSMLMTFLGVLAGVCAPCYYLYYNYDLGSVLAMLFGLLGILVIERCRGRLGVGECLGYSAFCLLSALTKESYIPALCLYGFLLMVINWTRAKSYILLVVIPLLAAAVSYYHSSRVGSPFVNIAATTVNPYHISLAPSSLLFTASYYYAPVLRPAFVVTLLLCGAMAYLKGRGLLFLALFVLGTSLQLPYLLLPNHMYPCYWWSPMSYWLLLLLVATAPAEVEGTPTARLSGYLRSAVQGPGLSLFIVVGTVWSISQFRVYEQDRVSFSLIVQDKNRNLLKGIRAARTELNGARSVLVLGLEATFHPWQQPDFLVADIGYEGIWYFPPSPYSFVSPIKDRVEVIDVKQKPLRHYDAILCFSSTGQLITKYSSAEIRALDRFSGLDQEDLYALLCAPATMSDVMAMPADCSAADNVTMALELNRIACHDLAAVYLQKVLALGGIKDPYPYFYLGRIHRVKKRYAAAVECFERAVEYDDSSRKNHFFAESLEEARMNLDKVK